MLSWRTNTSTNNYCKYYLMAGGFEEVCFSISYADIREMDSAYT
nr:hypothetical protein [Elizabethkingia sp. ASV34]